MNSMDYALGDVLSQLDASKVLTSTTNTESSVIPGKIKDVWEMIRWWKFEEMAPSIISAIEWTDGDRGRVDSTVKLTYA